MSYQVLARKWRPRTFTELVGQNEVLQTLTHALDNGRLHHAYLFTGTRGVGKTTIARIIAACVNCEQGVSSTPCGECGACREIAEGRFIDLIEVDAASRTKVEDTRELLENVQYAPSRGRYKVYLIDEVHMLSNHSFNALLKTLEEPPPHILFLLATTDPQKLPVTILSRCLQFSLRNMTAELTVRHLQDILQAEGIEAEESALWHLARAARGSMRDALTLLDQAISHGEGRVSEESVISLLGVPDQRSAFTLLTGVARQDAPAVLDCVATIAGHNPDYNRLLESLLAILHRVAIAQVLPAAIDNSEGDEAEIAALASSLPAEDIQLYYQMALNARQDFNLAPDLRMALEMLLLRMLAFTPHGPVELGQKQEQEQEKGQDAIACRQAPTADTSGRSLPAGDKQTEPAPPPASMPPAQTEKKKPDLTPAESAPVQATTPEPEPEPEPEPQPSQAPGPLLLTRENWSAIVADCALTGVGANLLANCLPLECSENALQLLLDERQSALFNERHAREIGEALSAYFGRPMQVDICTGVAELETPAAARLRLRQEKQQKAIDDFMNDSNVNELLDVFAATVASDTLTVKLEDIQ